MNKRTKINDIARRAAMALLLVLVTTAAAWAQNSPTVHVESLGGKHGSIYVKGWCEDPDEPNTPLEVQVYVKDNSSQPVEGYNPISLTADLKRFGEDNQWHYNGFDHYLPIPTAGTYSVDFVFVDATGDGSPIYNYSGIQVTAPYTVTYDANGGSGAPAQQQKSEGIALTLSSTVPTCDGHNFQRWTTAQNGGGTAYSPGATYTANADATLYAQWVASNFPGSGTATDPYVISTAWQWNLFASNVNNGNSYSGKYFVLGADINVSTMAGTNDTPFGGTFDGDGHTMNLAINATGTGGGHPNIAAAPFRYVNGATFKNINLTGTITRNDYPNDATVSLGGLVGILSQYRSATITGCHSSVSINYSFSWDSDYFTTGHIGGFIGLSDGNATITDCLFDGTLAGRPLHEGGFVGYLCWGGITFNNCLMSGTSSAYSTYHGNFFGKDSNGGAGSLNNCYYTDSIGTDSIGSQGIHTTATGETLRAQLGYGWIVNGSGAVVPCMALQLPADANNITTIAAANGTRYDKVILTGRTLYRDGSWNTLCLPFNLSSFSGTPLEGATVKTLSSSAYSNGVLTLSFTSVSSIEAGKPYIVKWSSGSNIENPMFTNVTISNATANVETTYANFLGSYAPFNSYSYLYDEHNAGGNGMNGALSISDPAPVSGQNVYWYTNSGHTQSVNTIPFDTDGNVTLYGLWSGTFTIHYELNGGTMEGNPTTYTIQSNITLVAPTREGYTFIGWTGSNGDTPQMSVTIPAGTTGDLYYTANWIPRVEYVEYNTSTGQYETKAVTTQFTTVTSSTTSLGNGWYVVTGNVRVRGSIGIGQNNTARLVLCDGAKLVVEERINLESNSTLIIYGQSNGTGILYAGSASYQYNAIGTPQDQRGGTVIVHSGTVVATTSGNASAAIGGFGNYGHGGTVRVYGGNVTAKGTGAWASGIGGAGWYGEGGTVEIVGGTVVAEGGEHGKAIGGTTGGESASDGNLSLGNVRVYASANASTPVNQEDRVSTCRTRYAKIEKCTQHVGSGSRCQYCNASIYHLTYNNNNATGGTVPTDATDYGPNQVVTILGNTGNLERTGYTFAGWNTEADGSGTSYSEGATFIISDNTTLYADWSSILELAGNADNSSAISAAAADGKQHRVVLADRTLYRDGTWNTLVLPFNLATLDGTLLEGFTVKTLASSANNNGLLTMTFSDATSIEAGKPYIVKDNVDFIIRSAADWNTFVNNVNNGNDYQGKIVKLAADISVTTMVGAPNNSNTNSLDGAYPFCGTFDGNGHTLTVTYSTTEQHTAPFRCVNGATIKNLHVAGSITTSAKFAAGVVGRAFGSTTVTNCRSSVEITSTVSGDGTHAGLVAIDAQGSTSSVTIAGCLFDGKLLGASTSNCGGLVGYRYASSGAVNISNSLFAPSEVTVSGTSSAVLCRDEGTGSYTNCYYTQTLGTAQGTDASGMNNETLVSYLGDGWEISNSKVVPKMENSIADIVSPTFENVLVSAANANVSTTDAEFIGSYAPFTGNDLLLDSHNPDGDAMHAAIRAKREGYTFEGCYTDAALTTPVTTIPFAADGTVTLYIKVSTPLNYTITYNLNGGTNHASNPTTYNIESATITLQAPTKTGYSFGGWFDNEDCTGDAVTTIATGSYGNVTLYAKWLVEELALANNGNNSSAISTAAASGLYHNVTLDGYTLYLDGTWNTLVLPFNLATLDGTPLEGFTVKTLESSTYSNGNLTLNFSDDLTSIEAGKPYIVKGTDNADLVIRTAADWNTFAQNIANGTDNYQGKLVKLAANISVSTMVGDESHPFKGTFDGCGHTLTFNYTTDADNAAPFQWIMNAVIKNLKVMGEIRSSQMFAAGFVARAYGDNAIENCVSSVTIHASKNGDGTHGGFVGRIESDCSTFTFTDCKFNGTFDGSDTDNWCPFAAWSMGNDNTHFTFNHCLCAPASTNVRGGCATFYRNGTATLNGAYYTQAIGTAQGTNASGMSNETLVSYLGNGWEISNGKVVPKMENSVANIVNPTFENVLVSAATANVSTTDAEFIGSYAPITDAGLLLDSHNPDGDAMHAAIRPKREGYTFEGWYSDAALTTPVTTIPFDADGNVTIYTTWLVEELELVNNGDNSSAISTAAASGKYHNVTLANRTIYKDGDWNTLCLPFSLASLTGTPLEGLTVKILESTNFADGTLTMNFSNDLTSIEAGKPYIVKDNADLVIRTAADWNTFAQNVTNGTTYQGKLVKLAADISVSTMVGDQSHPFKGTFDGCGHTLTFNYTTDADNAAPFQWIMNAVIKNLKVMGEIRSSQMFAAGFVARAYGDNAIENCVSSVTIHASKNGDGTHGGFVGRIESDCSTFTFTDCKFNGTFDGSDTDNWCPFAAWSMGNDNTHFTFNHCLCAPASTNVRGGCATFYRNGTATLNGAYYTQTIGTVQGTNASGMSNETLVGNLGSGWEISNDQVVPKMTNSVENIVNPVFSNVLINDATANLETDYVDFIGNYSSMILAGGDKSLLYLGTGNQLYYPAANRTINACRAYFQLKGIEAGTPAGVKEFVLNFGNDDDDDADAIRTIDNGQLIMDNCWYTLDGRKLSEKPSQSGVYIHNGRKVVVK